MGYNRNKLYFLAGKIEIGRIGREKIVSILVENESNIEKKITATRLLALGIFAFAFKKKKKNKALVLLIYYMNENNIKSQVLFKFEGIASQMSANGSASLLKKYIIKKETSSENLIQSAQINTANEIKKFKELLDEGIISQEEFDKKKNILFGL